jgi:cysteinyl-tRNA synthetase
VYDDSHIGHARAFVIFDVLIRHLKASGFLVTYVRNFTDLDDKIINRAAETRMDYLELAEKYIQSFHEDMEALGTIPPQLEPRATQHIPRMVADIQALVKRRYAYVIDGDVYYDVARFPEYGRLSGRTLEDMKAGARVEVDLRKRNPWDFALWKSSKPGEPSWESPWGPGRPGWHIECSVMSEQYLGPDFDIHGGGHDLIFPHHENEIAQSAGLGRGFARYWMHNGFVRVDDQKMSKSLNNFFTIKDVLKECHPEALRLFLLSKHYRSPIDFSDEALRENTRSLERIYRTLQEATEVGATLAEDRQIEETSELRTKFLEALDDDLNTAKALGHLFEVVRELNRLLDEARIGQADLNRIQGWAAAILSLGRILGLLFPTPAEFIGWQQAQVNETLSPEKIETLISLRTEARARKDWAAADRIRDELKAKGVILEDKGGETRWRIEA